MLTTCGATKPTTTIKSWRFRVDLAYVGDWTLSTGKSSRVPLRFLRQTMLIRALLHLHNVCIHEGSDLVDRGEEKKTKRLRPTTDDERSLIHLFPGMAYGNRVLVLPVTCAAAAAAAAGEGSVFGCALLCRIVDISNGKTVLSHRCIF